MTQREEFESAFKGYNLVRSKSDSSKYGDKVSQRMWEAYQEGFKAAKAQAVPQWIPVSERLPDSKSGVWSDTVIAVSDIGDVFALSFMGGYWQRSSAFINSGSTEIVGWMPIPELPAAPEQNK